MTFVKLVLAILLALWIFGLLVAISNRPKKPYTSEGQFPTFSRWYRGLRDLVSKN